MTSERERDYAIGYGKPPLQFRFKKGRSGNPRGRPRAAPDLASLLTKVLSRRVTITENGRRRKISKREAILVRLVDDSAAADPHATRLLLSLLRDLRNRPMQAPPEPEPEPVFGGPEDQEVLNCLVDRIRNMVRTEIEEEARAASSEGETADARN